MIMWINGTLLNKYSPLSKFIVLKIRNCTGENSNSWCSVFFQGQREFFGIIMHWSTRPSRTHVSMTKPFVTQYLEKPLNIIPTDFKLFPCEVQYY
jgi:hypothetical protein